jgi:hypothetical protein
MTLELHLTTLLIAAVAAAAALIAIWAAMSPRHWFWRALGVWAIVAAMLPIRVYEPAMVFAISLPLVVLIIRGMICLSGRWPANRVAASQRVSAFRFKLIDLLLAMLLLGLALAAMLHVARNLHAREFRPRTVNEIVLPAAAVVVVTVLGWCIVSGVRRGWAAAGLMVAIPAAGFILWSELPWLLLLDSQFSIYYVMPSQELDRRAFLLTILGLTEFAGLFVVGLAALKYAPSSIHRLRWWQTVRLASFAALVGGLGLLYAQMLWLAPFPPSLVPSENNYVRIREIAERVERLNESSISSADLEPGDPEVAEELRGLYRELLVLLETPNALPDDLSSDDWRALDARTSPDGFKTMRVLSRALVAESQAAAASNDIEQAVELALADLRLGTMLCRNAIMIDTLIGLAVLNNGGKQLATLRDNVDPATSRRISNAVRSLESTLEPEPTVIVRDLAFCDRTYGWQSRLLNVVVGLTGGSLEYLESQQAFIDGVNRWRAISRLLQTDLALRRHRDQQGSFPQALAELVPNELSALPIDPFTQRPLVYCTAGGEFTLYSVGRDRQDNGGRFGNASEALKEGYDFDLDTLTRP